jgi:hypothetical protein
VKKRKCKVADFVPLAEAVALNDKEVFVPVALGKLFHRAIQTRKNVARWFKSKTIVNNGNDERHNYFVNLLLTLFKYCDPAFRSVPKLLKVSSKGSALIQSPWKTAFPV